MEQYMTHENIWTTFADESFKDDAARAEAAARPVAERQRLVADLFVRYPRFEETVAAVKHFHMPLTGGTRATGKICGLIGTPRAGKSWAVRWYLKTLGTNQTNHKVPKALYIDARKDWTSVDLCTAFLRQIELKSRPKLRLSDLLTMIIDEIVVNDVELVIIDDAQFLLASKWHKTRDDTLGFVIGLAERNVCNVVLAGTDDIGKVIRADTHAFGRGSFPNREIQAYSWTRAEERKQFTFLLAAIDQHLPFARRSGLATPEIAAHLYRVSDGLIGRVMDYVRDAAVFAMEDKSQSIDVAHFRRAAQDHRVPGDYFEPFASTIDVEDPAGERQKAQRQAADDARGRQSKPTLSKSKNKSPLR
jgi:hypothetical protein